MTNQEIIDRMGELRAVARKAGDLAQKAARQQQQREIERMQQECGARGHAFTVQLPSLWGERSCAICDAVEPNSGSAEM